MKNLPKHVAIIMDGNGRWAESRLLPRILGHHRGVESARKVVQHCVDLRLPVLTLFAFSSENWRRPAKEVNLLMTLLQKLLLEEVHQLNANNVRLRVIGDKVRLNQMLQDAITHAETATVNNTGLQLNIALNYGGRWDIVQAAQRISSAVVAREINIADINEQLFSKYVMLADLAEPDLLIRTSGEQRLSNFLLWQMAYTEIYFTPALWPDFSSTELDLALEFFAQRQRRFGQVEQPEEA